MDYICDLIGSILRKNHESNRTNDVLAVARTTPAPTHQSYERRRELSALHLNRLRAIFVALKSNDYKMRSGSPLKRHSYLYQSRYKDRADICRKFVSLLPISSSTPKSKTNHNGVSSNTVIPS
jgi:hypothetical protein